MGELGVNEKLRIKTVREDLGYTQEKFAEILELSVSGYKKLESGEVHLTLDKIYLLKQKLGLSADYILYDEKAALNDVWMEICKLPIEEKWLMLMRMYAYLSKRTENEDMVGKLMKSVDDAVNNFLDTQNDEG